MNDCRDMSTPEFSRLFELERARRKPISETLTATDTEREMLAKRFDIVQVNALQAEVIFEEEAPHWFRLHGTLVADIVQRCIRTLDPLPEHIDETIELRITDDPEFKRIEVDDEDGVELSSGDDYEYTSDEKVDVGELLTQLLSTAMEPYPRKSDDELPAIQGVEVVWNSDDQPAEEQDVRNRPFAGLADLLAQKGEESAPNDDGS